MEKLAYEVDKEERYGGEARHQRTYIGTDIPPGQYSSGNSIW